MNKNAPRRDDTPHDHALSPVPDTERMAWPRVMNITLGVMGAMVFLQLPGQLALTFGVVNTLIALIYATVATGALAAILAVFAARTGLNIGLLTRAAGYGHRGASITQLCYAANFIVLAAIEGSIMAQALHAFMPAVPLWLLMVLLTLVNIVLNAYGIRLLDRFQRYSLPIYLLLLVTALVLAWQRPVVAMSDETAAQVWAGFDLWKVLACAGVLNGIVALQALLTADYARFSSARPLSVGTLLIGVVPQIASFLVMGTIGIWFTVRFADASPGHYLVALMGLWGACYTVLSQLRINLINVYSGALSLSGFASAVLGLRLRQGLWVAVTAILALIAMLLDVIGHVGGVLTLLGCVMFAWVASLMADLLIVRRCWQGHGANAFEYREDVLPAWQATGIGALLGGALVGIVCSQVDIPILNALASLIAAMVAFIIHLVLARARPVC